MSAVMHDDPTKPVKLTLSDYRARVAAYRAVQAAEEANLDGAITTWDTVNAVVDAYVQELREQRAKGMDKAVGRFKLENDRWRDLAAGENVVGCSDHNCECGGPR